jgi:hypothetical protein
VRVTAARRWSASNTLNAPLRLRTDKKRGQIYSLVSAVLFGRVVSAGWPIEYPTAAEVALNSLGNSQGMAACRGRFKSSLAESSCFNSSVYSAFNSATPLTE